MSSSHIQTEATTENNNQQYNRWKGHTKRHPHVTQSLLYSDDEDDDENETAVKRRRRQVDGK
jgi:hypothetical protein